MLLKDIFKKNKNHSGLTLAELVVASVIVGIIMVGIASMDIGVRNMFEGASKNAIVTTRVSVLISHVARNLSKAVGDNNDPGITIGTTPLDLWALRYREDADYDPSNYAGDQWYIYLYDSSVNSDHNVEYCETLNSASFNCTKLIQTLGDSSITEFVPVFTDDPASYVFKISLDITAIYDPSSPVDDIDNPEYSVTSEVSLPCFGSSI